MLLYLHPQPRVVSLSLQQCLLTLFELRLGNLQLRCILLRLLLPLGGSSLSLGETLLGGRGSLLILARSTLELLVSAFEGRIFPIHNLVAIYSPPEIFQFVVVGLGNESCEMLNLLRRFTKSFPVAFMVCKVIILL